MYVVEFENAEPYQADSSAKLLVDDCTLLPISTSSYGNLNYSFPQGIFLNADRIWRIVALVKFSLHPPGSFDFLGAGGTPGSIVQVQPELSACGGRKLRRCTPESATFRRSHKFPGLNSPAQRQEERAGIEDSIYSDLAGALISPL